MGFLRNLFGTSDEMSEAEKYMAQKRRTMSTQPVQTYEPEYDDKSYEIERAKREKEEMKKYVMEFKSKIY